MSIKIKAGQVVRDIKNGMHDNALMAKYNLSPGQLSALYRKLETAGMLEKPEVAPPDLNDVSTEDAPFVCPSCGMPQSRFFEECPQCGVILAKLPRSEDPGAAGTGTQSDSAFDRLPPVTVYEEPGSRILLLSCVAAGLLLVVGVLAFFLWPSGSGPDGSAAEKAARRAPLERRAPTTHGVTEPMKYIKNLPRLKEVNPEVDAEMRRSFRDVDSSLSKSRDELDRIMKEQ